MSDKEYFKRFKAHYEVMRMARGYIGQHPALIKMYKDDEQSDKHAANSAEDAIVAVMFLKGADHFRHGELLRDLHIQHTRGLVEYPKDPILVYELMTVYDNFQNKKKIGVTMENEEVTFITKEQKDKTWEERKKQLNRLYCGEKEFIKSEYPKYKATTNTTVKGVLSEVGGNANEVKGSDSDGQSVTNGIIQNTKGGILLTMDRVLIFQYIRRWYEHEGEEWICLLSAK